MKPAGKSEVRIMLSAQIFPLIESSLQLGEADAIERRNGKGVRPQGRTPSKSALVLGTQGRSTWRL
jgi:hypothetical protein